MNKNKNKNKKINKKILKKFFNLLDEDIDIKSCLSKFPDYQENLNQYAMIIRSFENLKKIYPNNDVEENSLKKIYALARVENIKNQKKETRKDISLLRLRPAYFKPVMIFVSIFIFMIFSFTGTIYASNTSIPGDLLYPVKRISENIQVTLTPYKYEKAIYLKMLNSRLSEAYIILSQSNIVDSEILEKLEKDIDDTYVSCRNRNYLDSDQERRLQNEINFIKEGFKKRYRIQRTNTNNYYDNDNATEELKNTENSNLNSNTNTNNINNSNINSQNPYQDNLESNNNGNTGKSSSPNTGGRQYQKDMQNQYGKW